MNIFKQSTNGYLLYLVPRASKQNNIQSVENFKEINENIKIENLKILKLKYFKITACCQLIAIHFNLNNKITFFSTQTKKNLSHNHIIVNVIHFL